MSGWLDVLARSDFAVSGKRCWLSNESFGQALSDLRLMDSDLQAQTVWVEVFRGDASIDRSLDGFLLFRCGLCPFFQSEHVPSLPVCYFLR